MNVQGLQKLTLLDFPGHTACTVFTGGCNMRCPFCHNSPLVLEPDASSPFTEQDVFDLLKKRKGILDGVAVTGGEPLLQRDLARFLARVKDEGFLVKLDTNGSFPDRLAELLDAGLVDYVAVDIKNSREKYPLTCGVKNFNVSSVEKTVGLLMRGTVGYEFRTTVVKGYHGTEDIRAIAEWIAGADKYFLQAFKDSGAVLSDGCEACDEKLMYEMRDAAAPFVGLCEIRGI